EIEEGVTRRRLRIAHFGARAHGKLVAKLGVAEMQMADCPGGLELRPIGGRETIDIQCDASLWSAEYPSAASDNAAAAYNRVAHQHGARRRARDCIDLHSST